jgi:dolichyl-phosphate beta-glucosyltransferase
MKWHDPVSIVIPCYNEEHRILPALERLDAFCRGKFDVYEILCVDDGSSDRTWDVIRSFGQPPVFVPLRLDRNSGKGWAVRKGMLNAKGRFCFFTDAELPYDTEAFDLAMEGFVNRGCDMVTGARDLPGSSYGRKVTLSRRVAGKIFSTITTCMIRHDIRDTQCGFKAFTIDAVHRIFPQQTVRGYAFDVELFMLACGRGLKICKIPVRLKAHEGSKVRLTRDPLFMVMDLVRLALRPPGD